MVQRRHLSCSWFSRERLLSGVGGALAFEVGEGLTASLHLAVVVCLEALNPSPGGLLGLFDAPPRVGSGSALQRTVPQPEGCVSSSDQSLFFIRLPGFPVRKNSGGFGHCHIHYTPLRVEKDRQSEGLQVVL